MAKKLVNQKEFARLQGVSPPYINKKVKDGTINLVNGLINVDEARVALNNSREPGINRKPVKDAPDVNHQTAATGYGQAKAVRETYMAKMARLDFEERTGKLVSAEDVETAAFNVGRLVRDGMLTLPDRISPLFPDAVGLHEILTTEIKIICESLGGSA